jgi:hypothetical protein
MPKTAMVESRQIRPVLGTANKRNYIAITSDAEPEPQGAESF